MRQNQIIPPCVAHLLPLFSIAIAISASTPARGSDLPGFDELAPSPINAKAIEREIDRGIEEQRAYRLWQEQKRRDWLKREALPSLPIRMIDTGAELTRVRLELIAEARKSLYLTTFHIGNDDASRLITDALCRRAREGIEVRFVVEKVQSKEAKNVLADLRACGAYVIHHRAPLISTFQALHEKLLIMDGKKMITGGSGYRDWYASASREGHYDVDFLLEGPAVCLTHREYQELFRKRVPFDRLLTSGKRRYGLDRFTPCDEDEGSARPPEVSAPVLALPIWGAPQFRSDRPLRAAYMKSIVAAGLSKDRKIRLYSPFFVPAPALRQALIWALRQGVEVEVLTNRIEAQDKRLRKPMAIAMKEQLQEFRAAGGKIFVWSGEGFMHRKGGVFGDGIVSFGSDNFDNRGQDFSSEQVVFTNDPRVISQMRAEFDEDTRQHSKPLTDEYFEPYASGASPLDRVIARLAWRFL